MVRTPKLRSAHPCTPQSWTHPPPSPAFTTVDGADGQDVEDGLDGQSVLDGQDVEDNQAQTPTRRRRRALFHSTPEGPIDRGTIQQAIWSKTQIYLMVTKTFARFSPDFI